ncbi:MAG: VirB4 family type IV secretion system protein, partial [Candidatus Dormibacteria bacterium]
FEAPRVDGWKLRQSGGSVSALIETANLDLEALDERRRLAVVEAFALLCRSLDFALEILVEIRRIPSVWADPDPRCLGSGAVALRLNSAMSVHWQEMLSRHPAYNRSVLFLPGCGPGRERHLERSVAAIIDATTRAGISARLLHGEDLLKRLMEAPGSASAANGDDTWHEARDHARIGRTLFSGYVVRRLPGSAVQPGCLVPLLAVRADCNIAIHLDPAGTAEAVNSLGRRLRGLSAQRLLDIDRGSLENPWNGAAIDSASALRERLARNVSRPLRLSLCAVARGVDRAALESARQELRAGFAATLSEVEAAHFRQVDCALTASPLGSNRLHHTKLVESRAAATCLPWTQSSFDDGTGYRLGALHGGGGPVRIDPFDQERYSNANVAVIAASGHGKSFAIGAVVLEALTRGTPSVIIDPEEEYRTMVGALGGQYVTLAPGGGTSINVFELVGTAGTAEGGPDTVRAQTTQVVVDLLQVLCGGRLDEVERAHIDRAAQRAQERADAVSRVAVLGDCLADLEATTPSVAVVLRRVCSGPLGQLFNRPSSIRVDTTVAGISFRDLSGEFVGAATLLVAQWLWCLVRDQRGRRHVIFDEVGVLGVHPSLRSLLVQLARRCRKYGASLVVATQNAQDLLQTDEGMVVATNCALVLLGGHRAAETARMERAFGLTDAQRRYLESATRGDFLLIAGNRRANVRVGVPDLHRRLLAGRSVRAPRELSPASSHRQSTTAAEQPPR